MKWKLINFWRKRFGGWFRYKIDTYGMVIEKAGLFQPVTVSFKPGFTISGTVVDGPVQAVALGQNVISECTFRRGLGLLLLGRDPVIQYSDFYVH
jgi:hypothetical protein